MTVKIDVKQDLVPVATEKLMKLEALKKNISKQIDDIKAQLLQVMEANNVLTLKTESYTLSRAERQTVKVVDFSKALQALKERDMEVTTVETFSDVTMNDLKQLVKIADVAGVEVKNTPYVSVRVNKERS